ncbi:MAG: 4a-hydroxytetrahydrobiopterin dehydratase [Deltaproteobacteria bacterium]|nr:4a-hydroxytetrahydrobiopterin dehydratase [Deltaproteobacteria bacterium]
MELAQKHCKPCDQLGMALSQQAVQSYLEKIPGWQLSDGKITKTYNFKNYYEVMAFVNALAWISHYEDHHPDLYVGYRICTVTYSTHAVNGLSENDFICAAKVDAL